MIILIYLQEWKADGTLVKHFILDSLFQAGAPSQLNSE